MTDPDATIATDYVFQTYDRRIEKSVSLRQATLERDLGRLHAWLGTEHVKPYWQLDEPLPRFVDALVEKLEDGHLTPYVGYLDHVPMSYWECYWAADDNLANHYDADPNDRGVHLLIGPEEYLGKGYAAPLLRTVVAMLFRRPETDRVVAEPDVRNDRVHRVFERCGFEPHTEFHFEEAEKDALLMVCDRERFEAEVLSEQAMKSEAHEVTSDV